MHAIDLSTVVYDAYLSCISLDYENNYWKNNISFSPTASSNLLMKSKFAHKDDYHGINRIYRNNTYIVEKSYADIMGRPYDELWVSLGSFMREMDTVIIENNTIDVYKLRMNASQPIHNYTFNNNEIHAYTVQETAHNCILPVSTLEHPAFTDTYIAKNNKISFDTSSPITEYQNSLIRVTGRRNELSRVKIIFENNSVVWPDLDAIVSSAYGASTVLRDVTIDNNTLETYTPAVTTAKTLYSGIYSNFGKLVYGNSISMPSLASAQ
ncbi:hypothetical protein UNSWDHB_14 [Dehalobacter sp. UNSWDHB]|nr:hypothetical protein UNSWDHB_14 [Dehalobacter sp. UNSWDHB]